MGVINLNLKKFGYICLHGIVFFIGVTFLYIGYWLINIFIDLYKIDNNVGSGTPGVVVPLVFGIIIIPIGVWLILSSLNILAKVLDFIANFIANIKEIYNYDE